MKTIIAFLLLMAAMCAARDANYSNVAIDIWPKTITGPAGVEYLLVTVRRIDVQKRGVDTFVYLKMSHGYDSTEEHAWTVLWSPTGLVFEPWGSPSTVAIPVPETGVDSLFFKLESDPYHKLISALP